MGASKWEYPVSILPVVRMSANGGIIDAREFHLDAATRHYRAEAVMEHGVVLAYPYKVVVPFD